MSWCMYIDHRFSEGLWAAAFVQINWVFVQEYQVYSMVAHANNNSQVALRI